MPETLRTRTLSSSLVSFDLDRVHVHHRMHTNIMLDRDENEAIDKSNIIQGDGLRHAKPQTDNCYNEGPDEDELPEAV